MRAAARTLTASLSEAMEGVTINAPSWEITRLAMCACRLHRPVGTAANLSQFLMLLRGWVEVLKSEPKPKSKEARSLDALRTALGNYQDVLDARGITCERVRRAAAEGRALRWQWCVWGILQRGVAVALLLALAAPGLALWMPLWVYVKRQERALLARGPRWNGAPPPPPRRPPAPAHALHPSLCADSVAETKMLYSFLGLCLYVGASVAYAIARRVWWPLLLFVYLYATMRCYEEAVADARSCYSLYKLLLLRPDEMRAMVGLRGEARAQMLAVVAALPAAAVAHADLTAEEATPRSFLDFYFPWWLARVVQALRRRKKKDWNEVLRLVDLATMDYKP